MEGVEKGKVIPLKEIKGKVKEAIYNDMYEEKVSKWVYLYNAKRIDEIYDKMDIVSLGEMFYPGAYPLHAGIVRLNFKTCNVRRLNL